MSLAVLQQQAKDGISADFPAPRVDIVHGNIAGTYSFTPVGTILHGTRSGQLYTVEQEYQATLNYVRQGANGLGWTVTIGEDAIAVHMTPRDYGWNARGASARHLAAEFAQARLGDHITDRQIHNFCYWWTTIARATWPTTPLAFPNHSELPEGVQDGKSDVEPRGQHSVRDRILARLGG